MVSSSGRPLPDVLGLLDAGRPVLISKDSTRIGLFCGQVRRIVHYRALRGGGPTIDLLSQPSVVASCEGSAPPIPRAWQLHRVGCPGPAPVSRTNLSKTFFSEPKEPELQKRVEHKKRGERRDGKGAQWWVLPRARSASASPPNVKARLQAGWKSKNHQNYACTSFW